MGKNETPEEKAARLEAENTSLKGKLAGANDTIKVKVDEIKTLKSEKGDLEKEKKELDGKYAELDGKYNQLVVSSTQEITALSEQLNLASKNAGSAHPILSRGRKRFKIIGKQFNFEGRDITVDQIMNNGELADKLIEKGVGFLIPVEE